MLTFPAPTALIGSQLAQELRAAGIAVADRDVTLTGDTLYISTNASAPTVQAVIDSHTPNLDFGVPDEDRQLRALRTKAQDVAAGNSTFTAAQMQKILAHLILRSTR